MIPTLILCSLDRLRGIVDVYNYIIRAVNILTFIYLQSVLLSEHSVSENPSWSVTNIYQVDCRW